MTSTKFAYLAAAPLPVGVLSQATDGHPQRSQRWQEMRSTRQIGRALSISPYTVQEHLTSIFDKVGVRSRGELVGQVFFRHCLPAIPD